MPESRFTLRDNLESRSAGDPLDTVTVMYELRQMLGCVEKYKKAAADGDSVGSNAFVESFGIHCRALTFFLFNHLAKQADDQPYKWFGGNKVFATDVLAVDFAPKWKTTSGDPPEVLQRAKHRADKEVAHIAHHRRGLNQLGTGKVSNWQLTGEADAICAALKRWLMITPASAVAIEAVEGINATLAAWNRPVSAVNKSHWSGLTCSPPEPPNVTTH